MMQANLASAGCTGKQAITQDRFSNAVSRADLCVLRARCWKTEYDIATWSYRRGLQDGYIPADVSNASTFVYPIRENGCVDAGYNYTAPDQIGGAAGLELPSAKLMGGLVLLVALYSLGC